MTPTADELAGIADCFGGVTSEEICEAIEDLAARQGKAFDRSELRDQIDEAIATYHLIPVEESDRTLLCPGPAALPMLPEGGEDLPHLLSIDTRTVDQEQLGKIAERRLRGEAASAVNENDNDRIEALLDICYELDTWAGTETESLRKQLAQHLR